jgi:hypothetical protein
MCVQQAANIYKGNINCMCGWSAGRLGLFVHLLAFWPGKHIDAIHMYLKPGPGPLGCGGPWQSPLLPCPRADPAEGMVNSLFKYKCIAQLSQSA